MTTRRYDLNTGIETSSTPTVSDPSTDTDIMSKGYADTTYAARQYWGHSVADTTALKAIGTSGANARFDQQLRLKDDDNTIWKFDSASAATEDGTTVIQPTSGTGRWLIASGSGTGGAGGASGLEQLQDKLEAEGFGIKTRELDNSLGNSANDIPLHTFFTGYLIENYTSGGASVNVVWNPIVLNDSDKQYDSATGYSVTGAGASLSATAGSNKVGSNKFTFDKNGTAVEAGVRYDRGAQTLSVGGNYRVWFWINLPSTTNLTNVGLRMYADTTSNYRTWTTTTDYAGNALAVGWNLIFVDISTGGTASGTGWTYTTLSRYQEIFLTTSSAAQTYSAILLDGIWFSHGAISEVNFNSLEMTGFDNSNKNNFVLDTANTRYDGPLTLDATVAQNYTAGISNAAATLFRRSTLSWSTGGSIGFDTSLTSGAIALDQEVRLIRQFRESLSGNLSAFVDLYTPQVYKVTAVGGSTIDVEDPANTSANLLNGDSIHIFERIINAGEITFAHRATRSLTAGASHSSGTTTLTVTTTSIAVGDYVVKQHLTARASLVSKTADESFTTLTYDTSPNGVQLINQGRAVPNPNNLWAAWDLGGSNDTFALRDKSGQGRPLTKTGNPNIAASFLRGRLAYTTSSTSDYLYLPSSTYGLSTLNASSVQELVQASFWLYYDNTYGATRNIIGCYSYHGGADERGWVLMNETSQTTLRLYFFNSAPGVAVTSGSLSNGTWNHICIQVKGGTAQTIFLNGIKTTTGSPATISGAVASNPSSLSLGINNTAPTGAGWAGQFVGMRMADLLLWRGGSLLTDAQVLSLYNAGAPVPTGFFPVVRNEYELTGQSGQKLSMKANLARSTSAVSPQIYDLGIIKT